MNCQLAQDQLLALEGNTPDMDLAVHLESCPACTNVFDKLCRLELAVADLPPVEGSLPAKQSFLAQLQPAQPAPLHRNRLRQVSTRWAMSLAHSGRRYAMAASLLLAASLCVWLIWANGVQKASASESLVDRMVDWNVNLASAESPDERDRIFANSVGSFKDAIAQGKLPSDDQALVQKLLETGSSLSKSIDPLDDAEQFSNVADLLLRRMDTASTTGNLPALQTLSRNYARVTSDGLTAKLARAKHSPPKGIRSQKHPTLETIVDRDTQLRLRLDALLEKSPDASRKQIRRAMKAAARGR